MAVQDSTLLKEEGYRTVAELEGEGRAAAASTVSAQLPEVSRGFNRLGRGGMIHADMGYPV
jgi:hypothetical protein